MPPTGDVSERTGIYRSTCCNEDMTVGRGERFPFCKACQKAVTWSFIRPCDSEPTAPGSIRFAHSWRP